MTAEATKSGFTIEVGCPGCGGELELEEDFFVLTCSHCGSNLRIIKPDLPAAYLVRGKLPRNEVRFRVDRFLKKRNLPLTGSGLQIKNFYYPYWKIDAMLAKVRNRIERREIRPPSEYDDGQYMETEKSEISIGAYSVTVAAGNRMDGIPFSIGMRTEYIQMQPYSEEEIQDTFDSLPIMRANDEDFHNVVLKYASANAIGVDSVGINKTELLDPTYSLIFFPYHVVECYDSTGYCRFLIDGVSGRVLHHRHPLDRSSDAKVQYPSLDINLPGHLTLPGWEESLLGMVPDEALDNLACDSDDEKDTYSEPARIMFGALGIEPHRCPNCGEDLPGRQSHMYICRNCHEMVLLEKPSVPVNGIAHTAVDDRLKDQLFPFWSFKVSDGDTEAMRRLFAGIFNSDRIVIPAFSFANFEALYRLAKRMSAAAPKMALVPTDHTDSRFLPVDISPNQALTQAHLLMYRELLARNQSSEPEEVALHPEEVALIFASFHPESYFWVDSVLGAVTFEKNLVS